MGSIAKILTHCKLPPRDDHNSRIFIDMSENIHIHYREHRFVFSVKEFMIFVKAIEEAKENLIIELNQGYKENLWLQKFKIIGGSQKEYMPLDNPQESAYFNDRLQIEAQIRGYGDIIHLHYRDYRTVFRKKETWDLFCQSIAEAYKNMEPLWKNYLSQK